MSGAVLAQEEAQDNRFGEDLGGLCLTWTGLRRYHTADTVMIISDLSQIEGRRYPARRRTRNLVGGLAPIQCRHFCLGHVTLDPQGGQVPWHNQDQEEIYFILEGTGEMCLGEERQTVRTGQAVFIPPGVFHQLTNIGDTPLRMLYCYGPAGEVAHWRQELSGTLPRAGLEAPPLPDGACPQCTEKPA